MRLIYDLFFFLFSVLYLPYLLVKGKFHRDFFQRFGFLPEEVTSLAHPVWIHAVSVGEAALAGKIALAIKNDFPEVPVIVSTTTKTGNHMIKKFSSSRGNIINAVFYYPVDFSCVVSKVVRLVSPRIYVMMETEIWPNLLEELNRKKIPVILANGRISDSSFSNYKRIKFITRRVLKCINSFCMQTERDAERVRQLGAQAERVHVTGNLKFDEKAPLAGSAELTKESLGFSSGDKIIVAGSTHSPEEETIIEVYSALKKEDLDLKLILAPRHVERASKVKEEINSSGLTYELLSEVVSSGSKGRDILLVDTIGHLKDLYSIATVVFVGGSLTARGGQNPIEAALWGKAVLFGPHMSNFREVEEIFLENSAAVRVEDALKLKSELKSLLEDSLRRDKLAENALKVINKNSGATLKTLEKIKEYIK